MKAVRIREPEGFEGIGGLVYENAPDPQPAIGDARVQVSTDITVLLDMDEAQEAMRGAATATFRPPS
jgi:hypothetical protein